MLGGSSNPPAWRSGRHSGLGGIDRSHLTAPPAKRQHSLVDNPFDTNPGNNHANHQIRDNDNDGGEDACRHKRLRTLTPRPHSTSEYHSSRNQTPSPRATPMEEAEACAQEDTRRAMLLINELTNLVNIRLNPTNIAMTISGPAKNDLTKAALNLSRLLKQHFGGSVELAEEDDDDYYPLDMDYYGDDDGGGGVSNASSPTVDGSTSDPRIYTGDLARPGWTESEYSGPETPESGFEEALEDRFAATANQSEQTDRVREIVVIEDSDCEPENPYEGLAEENYHGGLATSGRIEKEVIEIPDDDDNESVIFTGENVIQYMRYFPDRPLFHSPERVIMTTTRQG